MLSPFYSTCTPTSFVGCLPPPLNFYVEAIPKPCMHEHTKTQKSQVDYHVKNVIAYLLACSEFSDFVTRSTKPSTDIMVMTF